MTSIFNNLLIKTQTLLRGQNAILCSIRSDHSKLDSASHKVNNLEKRFLVWTKKFKSIEEVPAFVPYFDYKTDYNIGLHLPKKDKCSLDESVKVMLKKEKNSSAYRKIQST